MNDKLYNNIILEIFNKSNKGISGNMRFIPENKWDKIIDKKLSDHPNSEKNKTEILNIFANTLAIDFDHNLRLESDPPLRYKILKTQVSESGEPPNHYWIVYWDRSNTNIYFRKSHIGYDDFLNVNNRIESSLKSIISYKLTYDFTWSEFEIFIQEFFEHSILKNKKPDIKTAKKGKQSIDIEGSYFDNNIKKELFIQVKQYSKTVPNSDILAFIEYSKLRDKNTHIGYFITQSKISKTILSKYEKDEIYNKKLFLWDESILVNKIISQMYGLKKHHRQILIDEQKWNSDY